MYLVTNYQFIEGFSKFYSDLIQIKYNYMYIRLLNLNQTQEWNF
jgi:hypothetical protein